MEAVTDCLFSSSKSTENGDSIQEIKRHLVGNALTKKSLGRKALTNLDSLLKSRDISLPTKLTVVKLWFSSSHIQI